MELKFVYTLDEACTQPVDAGIRKIILYVAQNFGNDVTLKKLDEYPGISVFWFYIGEKTDIPFHDVRDKLDK